LDALLNCEPVKRLGTGLMWANLRVLVTARAEEFRVSWRRPSGDWGRLSKRELQKSSLDWLREVAMVRAVEKSRVLLILQRSRIDRKQDLETEEIWSVIEKIEYKISPSLRADLAGVIAIFEGIRRKGSDTSDCWAGRPIWRNSVLDWLSDRRLADIHWETKSRIS